MYNYNELKSMYKEQSSFDTCNIDLLITPSVFDGNPIYELESIKIDNSFDKDIWIHHGLDDYLKKIKNNVNELNIQQSYSSSHKLWSVFYSIKELIDVINDNIPSNFETYFRGQNGSWELMPTLFRKDYDDSYRENFEIIYKDIARRYPEKIKYFSIGEEHLDDRADNLSELQHYGIGTPLVDVTRNPFIAMLFMVEGYKDVIKTKYNNPQLDIFFVNKNGENLLFQESKKNENNLRIDAQQGAFLNFDKLFDNNGLCHPNGLSKICKLSIRIKLKTVENSVLENIDNEKNEQRNNNSTISLYSGNQCALLTAIQDIKSKLSSFYYIYDSLFPDFYMYLKHIKNKYKGNVKEDNLSKKWYVIQP